jgi:hypothetical protein
MHAEPALAHIQPGARASASFAFIPAYLLTFALKPSCCLSKRETPQRQSKQSSQRDTEFHGVHTKFHGEKADGATHKAPRPEQQSAARNAINLLSR